MNTLVQNVSERLRSQGGRMTGQRRLICETLENISGHPTAEELFDKVQVVDPSLSLSTVYRTLRWLEGEGLVSARRFDGDQRQERFDPVHPFEHHHFLCTVCHAVIEFDNPLIDQISAEFERNTDVLVECTSLELYGLCSRCQKRTLEE
ncbi:Fur family transcriptional regulator [Chloroflexota bacterium]